MRYVWILVLLCPAALAWDADDQDRFRALTEELRCLVCQNQSIAESGAPLAEDLRRQVRQRIENGESDREIRTYMTARYGDFVLYRPPLKGTTYALWFGPAVLLLIGIALIWRLRRSPPSAPSDAVSAAQIDAILKRADDE